MTDDEPQYSLLPLRLSDTQNNTDHLVAALWRCAFHRRCFGQNHQLAHIFALMSRWPAEAALRFGRYYFDGVTDSIQSGPPEGQREHRTLQLRYFDSWADEEEEQQRSRRREARLEANRRCRWRVT